MPIYEYSCDTCGDDFEKLVSFSASDQMPKCPKCNGDHVHKKISLFSSGVLGSSAGASYAGGNCGTSSFG
jgi:putative FmdB family regulatory protein